MKTLSKILLAASLVAVSVIYGHILAEVLFSPLDPRGDDIVLACDVLVGMAIYFLYKVIRRPFREAAAARLARYEARRDAKFAEIEARTFMMRYETFRRDFLEGRGEEC